MQRGCVCWGGGGGRQDPDFASIPETTRDLFARALPPLLPVKGATPKEKVSARFPALTPPPEVKS